MLSLVVLESPTDLSFFLINQRRVVLTGSANGHDHTRVLGVCADEMNAFNVCASTLLMDRQLQTPAYDSWIRSSL